MNVCDSFELDQRREVLGINVKIRAGNKTIVVVICNFNEFAESLFESQQAPDQHFSHVFFFETRFHQFVVTRQTTDLQLVTYTSR